MGTFVSNHGKMLRLTWPACTLEVQLQHCHVAKEETGSVTKKHPFRAQEASFLTHFLDNH